VQIKPTSTVATANPGATNAARGVLALLFQLQKNKQILLGQDLGHGSTIVSGFDKYVTGLNTKVGKWIGMIGGDYGLDPNHNVAQSNRIFIDYSKRGAIVTLSWTMDNPWTGGDAWDTNNQENLWELITPGNRAYTNWEAQKLAVANALTPLRDAGVVVLWRPLHEMNGDWFWWCQKTWSGSEEAFIAVWQDMFNYLTYNKGLNNLLWVYSTATSWDRLLKNYYPGKEYVDIVGIDIYNDNVETWFSKREL
jgi:mannan endo-1,4-beta-mannosidase